MLPCVSLPVFVSLHGSHPLLPADIYHDALTTVNAKQGCRMSQMLKSSAAMAAATVASRVLGLLREMVYAHFLGAGPVKGAFDLAFMIPNLFRRLLGEGALTAAFLPLLKEKEVAAGDAAMWQMANAVISGFLVTALAVIAGVLFGVSGYLAWANPQGDVRLMLQLLVVMFPYMGWVCLAAIFMGMLNTRGFFFIPALGAALLNVVMITAVLVFARRMTGGLERQIFALAYGVLVAGIAQAAYQLPALHRTGFRFRWVTPWRHDSVRTVARKMIPGTVGVAAFQLNMLVTQGVAFVINPEIIASFNYAVRLMEFPQGVVGVSLFTFLLPTLSGLAAEKRFDDFKATLTEGLGYLVYINAFAAAMAFVLAEPIVRLILERGAFDPLATQRTALPLACLAPGLIAFSCVGSLTRAFYALGEIKVPVRLSILCLGLNLVFALILIFPFEQAGLAAANTLSAICQVALLVRALRRHVNGLDLRRLRRESGWIALAAAISGAVAWGVLAWWELRLGAGSVGARLGAVFVPMLIAGLVYGGVTWCMPLAPARDIAGILRERLVRRQ